MGSFKKLPKDVQNHLMSLSGISDMTATPAFQDLLAEAWNRKEKIFTDQVNSFGMRMEHQLSSDEKRAFLVLTYSGSILGVGPVLSKGVREIVYASIGFRKDVPEQLKENKMRLKNSVRIDQIIEFTGGSLKKSSPVYKIAVMTSELQPFDQTRQIEEAANIITREFVTINNTIIPE